MKKLTQICSFFLLIFLVSSCEKKETLQSYLVDTSGKEGFYTGDIPISSVLSPNADVPEDVKETMKSIKKINIAFLAKTADNEAMYITEKSKLKAIFSDTDEYKSLMTMKMKGMNVNVFYTGKTESIDEVIAFGYSNEAGVGVARLLGENMNPAKIMSMLESMSKDGVDEKSLQNFAKMLNVI